MRVPFFELKTQTNALKEELIQTFEEVLDQSEFIYGHCVTSFEKDFAKYLGVQHCVGVSSGADALYIALKTLGIGRGDEVITSAHSWISTADAIARTGAEPVFVDTDKYHLLDTSLIESKLTQKTKAILPVHLYGQMVDVTFIKTFCDHHHLYLVEDCAQAHGASFKEIAAGTTGHLNAFSFYPTKNLGAFGDAGAITTNDSTSEIRCRTLANNGLDDQKTPETIGINSRMDAMQAAFLSLKLKKLDDWNARRQTIAHIYLRELSTITQISLPQIQNNANHVYHVFAIEVEKREALRDYLQSKAIETAIHYNYLLPFTKNYRYQNNQEKDFKQALHQSTRLLSLPLYPELTDEQIHYVCDCVRSFYVKP